MRAVVCLLFIWGVAEGYHHNRKLALKQCNLFCFVDDFMSGVPPQGALPQGVPPQGVPPQGVPPQIVVPTTKNPIQISTLPSNNSTNNNTKRHHHHKNHKILFLKKSDFNAFKTRYHRFNQGRYHGTHHQRNFPQNCQVVCCVPEVQGGYPGVPPLPGGSQVPLQAPSQEVPSGDDDQDDGNDDEDDGTDDTYVPGEDTAVEATKSSLVVPEQPAIQLEDFGADGNPSGDLEGAEFRKHNKKRKHHKKHYVQAKNQ